jgi:hypothetical protein
MAGYWIDLGNLADIVELTPTADALVAIVDRGAGIVGLATVTQVSELYEETGTLSRDALTQLAESRPTPIPIEVGEALVFQFDEGVVAFRHDEIGVAPIALIDLSGGAIEPVFRATALLPGTPTTTPALFEYQCDNGHHHWLQEGSEGDSCPTCGLPLWQV